MAGNIIIIEPLDNFQKVSKDIIYNQEVDALTLGIYVKILCLGKEWELNIKGLSSVLQLSDARIKVALSKLEKVGYIKRVHVQGQDGRFIGFDYHIGATPFPEDERTDLVFTHSRKGDVTNLSKNQPMENPTDGKTNGRKNQPMEKREDIYRDNKENKDNTLYKDKKENREKHFVRPSLEEVSAYCLERQNGVDAVAFFDFYESKGWKVGRDPMKDWKAAVRTWERRERQERRPQARPARSSSAIDNMLNLGREMFGLNSPRYDEQ